MFETIKDNPIPALAAGLSVGYLVIKAAESDHDRSRRGPYRGSAESWPGRGREDRPWEYDDRYARTGARRGAPRSGYEDDYDYDYDYEYEDRDDESARDRLAERGDEIRGRASEKSEEARQRAEEGARVARDRAQEGARVARNRAGRAARGAQRQAKDAGRYARRRAARAENAIEDFVNENPLVAGLITAGIGAIVGAAFPSTSQEDRMMGPARDQLVDRARQTAEGKAEEAKGAARRVGEEAKDHAKDLKQTAQQEAKEVGSGEEEKVPATPAPATASPASRDEITGGRSGGSKL